MTGLRDGIANGRRSGALAIWLLCLCGIAGTVVAYIGHAAGTGAFGSDRWDADLHRSATELLGYGFLLIAVGLFLRLYVVHAAPVHAAWAGALTLLVLDDALFLHERTGTCVERDLNVLDPPGLRIIDVGELGTGQRPECS